MAGACRVGPRLRWLEDRRGSSGCLRRTHRECDSCDRTVTRHAMEPGPWSQSRLHLARHRRPGRELVAVGACTFGIPVAHGIGLAPAIGGWEDLVLGDELAATFGGSIVRLTTDVKATAAAEASSGALVGHDPALYVNLGTGLAVAIVCGGRVISGANGAAGEIGYNLRQLQDVGLTDRVVLEEVVSGMGLLACSERVTGRALAAAEVFAGEASDPRLGELMGGFRSRTLLPSDESRGSRSTLLESPSAVAWCDLGVGSSRQSDALWRVRYRSPRAGRRRLSLRRAPDRRTRPGTFCCRRRLRHSPWRRVCGRRWAPPGRRAA